MFDCGYIRCYCRVFFPSSFTCSVVAGEKMRACWEQLHVSENAAKILNVPPLLVRPSHPGVMRMSQRSEEGSALFLAEVKWPFGRDCSNTRWAVSCIPSQALTFQRHTLNLCSFSIDCVESSHKSFHSAVLSSFEVPRMWYNRA